MGFSGPGQVRREAVPSVGGTQVVRTRLFNYDIGDASMKSEHRDWLTVNLLPILQKSRNTTVNLWGTASRSGSDQFNRALSEKRANFIRDFLAQKGAARDQIQFKGLGENPAKAAGVKDGTESPEERAVLVDVNVPAKVAKFEHLLPTQDEDGFDPFATPPFLMLPALLQRKTLRLVGGETLRLRSSNHFAANLIDPLKNMAVSELIVSADRELITFQGLLPGTASIIGENVNGDKRVLLDVHTFLPRTIDIDFYVVEDSKVRLPVHRDRPYVEAMVNEATKLWRDQANVSFRINKFERLKVAKDLGKEVTNAETSAGKNFHNLSDLIKSPARINVFLVWEWNPDDGNADAEVNSIGNKFIIFEDDLSPGSTPGRVLGHEIGHLFTLTHDKLTTDALMFGGVGLTHGRLRKKEILKARKGI